MSSSPYVGKKVLIGCNWKCNGKQSELPTLLSQLTSVTDVPPSNEVVVAVPALNALTVRDALAGTPMEVAAQNVAVNTGYGAYTGEISADMLMDAQISWTLTGHSERRTGFGMAGEDDDLVGRKTAAALSAGMRVIACIGETLEQREAGETGAVCARQMAAIAKHVKTSDWANIVIAYEPVWAIGTGRVATPEMAEATHAEVRAWISENVGETIAKDVRIIYGGSVKGSNAATLLACKNIDGFLIGGASLLPEIADIIRMVKPEA